MSIPDPAIEIDRLIRSARSLWDQRQLVDSEEPLRRALELAESSFGPDDPHVASVSIHLAWIAAMRGRTEEAIDLYRRTLAIREARLGPGHPETLHAAEDLAAALFRFDPEDEEAEARNEEADALALRAIAGHEAAGRDDAELAALIATVAFRRFWVGLYAEAEPLFLRALAMQERLLGPDDPATADTALRLALMYDRHWSGGDPEPYYRRALAGFEAALAEDHPEVLQARFRLADYLHRQGRDDEADPLFERLVVAIDEAGDALDLDKVDWILGGCCRYLRSAGRSAEAEAIRRRASACHPLIPEGRSAVERAEAAFGAESLDLAEALVDLAGTYIDAGRADEPEESMRRALAIYTARLGPDHPTTTALAARLAGARERAEWHAAHRSTPRLLGDTERLFDAFTFPWSDERRPDLIRAYLTALMEDDRDDPDGAVEAMTALTFMAEPDEHWDIIRELIARAPDDDRVLQALAAGPLEGFLGRFGEAVIDQVEAEAARDPGFRHVLSGVWKHMMPDPVWERVRAIQATVPDPLPEMRPFAPDEHPRR
jgi:tetratricopeptide (TPR) repeat protein